ncbi:MAG: hypothetical protein ACJ74W_18835 [Pyrinomonadaceae bacterium]
MFKRSTIGSQQIIVIRPVTMNGTIINMAGNFREYFLFMRERIGGKFRTKDRIAQKGPNKIQHAAAQAMNIPLTTKSPTPLGNLKCLIFRNHLIARSGSDSQRLSLMASHLALNHARMLSCLSSLKVS